MYVYAYVYARSACICEASTLHSFSSFFIRLLLVRMFSQGETPGRAGWRGRESEYTELSFLELPCDGLIGLFA